MVIICRLRFFIEYVQILLTNMTNIFLIELQVGEEKLLRCHWISFLIIHALVGFFILLLFVDDQVTRYLVIDDSNIS